jgi:predicted amidohydrolase
MKAQLVAAVVQLTSTDDVQANLSRAAHWVRRAAAAGAELVALPENFGFLGGDFELLRFAQAVETSSFLLPLRELARELGICVVAGSIPEAGPDPQHVYNTSVLLGPAGETLATYRKIHLFDVGMGEATFSESQAVAPGSELVVQDVQGWPCGLSICYDLRFPELYRGLSRRGARLLSIPSAFTLHTGKDHWEVLLRARAIENQAYVLAPAQWGRHNPKRVTWGKSMIVDPWGTPLCTVPEREGFAVATLDADAQAKIRADLPALQNTRL